MKQRLAVSESKVEVLEAEYVAGRKENAAQEAELAVLKTRLAATETQVEHLEKEIKEAPKVAFSAALTNSWFIESGDNDLNLVFSRVITNVGESYSSTSGFFTAPVRGVYYFRFTVMDKLSSRYMDIRMHKNGQQLMWLYEYDTDGHETYLSSGLTLQLEEGDVVNMVLPAGRRLYDSINNHSIFSGFLLFPL
ncbi:complement C1q-like protein 4 [Engraulis encrasicolus]|uniref:complement C1q-like protein 4 n=1 Tax=Engraulis encrasicolus TaxID=184585 RepID=UPI002FD68C0D